MGIRVASLASVALVFAGACQRGREDSGTGARVVGVADGDTVTVLIAEAGEKRTEKVRLYGVDCPESAQPFGNKAKKLASDLVFDKQVKIERVGKGKDRYGRTIARVRVGELVLNEELLRAGLAWHYKRYDDSARYAALEREAREAKRGLWAEANPMAPWDWRRQRREKGSSAPSPPLPDAPYHGNVRSRVLHAPDCKHYRCKNCKARFGNVEAAKGMGYKPHSCAE